MPINETKIISENIKKLTPGQEFKSYKALCDYLGLVASGGNKRIAQKKKIQKYCKLSTIPGTNKYVFEGLSDSTDDELSSFPKNIGLNAAELLLLDYLASNEGASLLIPTPKLWNIFAFINGKFFRQSYFYELMNDYKIMGGQINNFKQRAYKRFHQLTYSYLNDLKNNGFIDYEHIDIMDYTDGYYCELNETDKKILNDVEKKALRELDKTDVKHVINSGQEKLYFKTVNNMLANENIKIKGRCKGFKLSKKGDFNKFILSEKEKEKLIISSNNFIMKSLLDNAKTKFDNYNKKLEEIRNMPLTKFPDNISYSFLSNQYIYTNNYLENQKTIINTLIKITLN